MWTTKLRKTKKKIAQREAQIQGEYGAPVVPAAQCATPLAPNSPTSPTVQDREVNPAQRPSSAPVLKICIRDSVNDCESTTANPVPPTVLFHSSAGVDTNQHISSLLSPSNPSVPPHNETSLSPIILPRVDELHVMAGDNKSLLSSLTALRENVQQAQRDVSRCPTSKKVRFFYIFSMRASRLTSAFRNSASVNSTRA